MSDDHLVIWTIYRHPADLPGVAFAVRGFDVMVDGPNAHGVCATAATLEEARRLVPPGSVRLRNTPGDDPAIVECWI